MDKPFKTGHLRTGPLIVPKRTEESALRAMGRGFRIKCAVDKIKPADLSDWGKGKRTA